MDPATRRLTEFSHGAGCACELAPGDLAQVLRRLTPAHAPELLVGNETGDDAAVWRLDDERALVLTADFITPLVDDARDWGRIAAANAASDVYAMGGRPLLALNLVGWPVGALSNDVLVEVLEGAGEVAAEAGFVIVGGHTVDDPEPKYGLAVVGEAHPDRLLTNAGLPGTMRVSKTAGTRSRRHPFNEASHNLARVPATLTTTACCPTGPGGRGAAVPAADVVELRRTRHVASLGGQLRREDARPDWLRVGRRGLHRRRRRGPDWGDAAAI